MSTDNVLSSRLHIDPSDFVVGGRGSRADLFHPQARYTSIRKVRRQLESGPHAGETVHALLVEGSRPGALNLYVKRFVVAVTVNRKEHPDPQRDEALIDGLESYLLGPLSG